PGAQPPRGGEFPGRGRRCIDRTAGEPARAALAFDRVSNRENESANLEFARRYIAAIEAGATGDALASFFTPDVVITEFPNRFIPNGRTSELSAALAAAERGQQLMRDQRYQIISATAMENRVVLELDWTGIVTV